MLKEVHLKKDLNLVLTTRPLPVTIYKLAQEGKIPATKVGNQWRFRKEKIDEWMDQGGKVKTKKWQDKKNDKA